MSAWRRAAASGATLSAVLGLIAGYGALELLLPASEALDTAASALAGPSRAMGGWTPRGVWLGVVATAVAAGSVVQLATLAAIVRVGFRSSDGSAAEGDPKRRAAGLRHLPLAALVTTLTGWMVSAAVVALVGTWAVPTLGGHAREIAGLVLAVGTAVTPLRYFAVRASLRRQVRAGEAPATMTQASVAPRMSLRAKLGLGLVLPGVSILALVACTALALGARATYERARWRVDASAHELASLVDAAVRMLRLPSTEAQHASLALVAGLDRGRAPNEIALLDRSGAVAAGRFTLLEPRRARAALDDGRPLSRIGQPIASGAKLDTSDLWLVLVEPSPYPTVAASLLDPRLLGVAALGTLWLAVLAALAARDVVAEASEIQRRVLALPAHSPEPRDCDDELLDDELGAIGGAIGTVAHQLRRSHRRHTKHTVAFDASAARSKHQIDDVLEALRGSTARAATARRALAELEDAGTALAELGAGLGRNVSAVAPLGSAAALGLEGALATCDQMARELNDVRAHVAELVSAARPVVDSAEALRATTDSATSTAAVAEDLERAIAQRVRAAREGLPPLEDQAQVVERALATAGERSDRVRIAMGDVGQAVHRIEETVGGLSRGIALMEELADRSAFLAVNVAILAARAGASAGGFSIVADEMRDLAQRAADGVREAGGTTGSLSRDTHAAVLGVEAVLMRVEQTAASIRDARTANQELGRGVTRASTEAVRTDELVAKSTADTVRAREHLLSLVATGQRMLGAQAPLASELERSVALDTTLRLAGSELSGAIRGALVRGRDQLREPVLLVETVERLAALTQQVTQLVAGLASSLNDADRAALGAQQPLELLTSELTRWRRFAASELAAAGDTRANEQDGPPEASRFS